MKKGRAGTMTHDYKRNGTTTLFAALNVLDGSVIGQCMQRHRHQEFIRFLNRIERDVAGRQADPRHPRQLRHPQAPQGPRLARPPRALDLPLHPDLGLLAERRRGLLRQAHQAAPAARRVPLRPSHWLLIASSATSLNSAENRLRLLMVDYPLSWPNPP